MGGGGGAGGDKALVLTGFLVKREILIGTASKLTGFSSVSLNL